MQIGGLHRMKRLLKSQLIICLRKWVKTNSILERDRGAEGRERS